MKILVATAVIPNKKNKLIKYIENIVENIKVKIPVKIFWLVYQPEHVINQKIKDGEILDIHDFENSIELLEKIKPDCVIANNNSRDTINYSLTIAANYLKIPLVFSYLNDQIAVEKDKSDMTYSKHFMILLRNFFSSKIPTDSKNEKKTLRRGKFFYYKNMFLFKTRKSNGMSNLKATRLFINDLIWHIRYKKPVWNNCGNLNLCSNLSWYEFLIKNGIDSKKITITGSPYWDKIYNKIKLREKQQIQKKDKIRVLIITSPLVEHGFCTKQERENYLTRTFSELVSDEKISFALKIHPTSEDKKFYENFLFNLKINTKIYQKEDFWDIINEYDIVLSIGPSTINTECAYGGIKMILFDGGWNFRKVALVKEAISDEFFIECKKFEEIKKSIFSLYEKDIGISHEVIKAREK
ncbi:hypothetical protein HX850_01835, partial [Marine Group I thaumarchaeote]|nr:hypothetical protein [Marine Group I thaumarchaeote]